MNNSTSKNISYASPGAWNVSQKIEVRAEHQINPEIIRKIFDCDVSKMVFFRPYMGKIWMRHIP